ncbi:MAG TPA: MBL fold metallo-hydrolase [Gemmatimonadaceae bacterium]|nr:MBL fold metallo-hydrolase [Gemmatimonadaceae bacterium]
MARSRRSLATGVALAAAALLTIAGCGGSTASIVSPSRSAVALTAGPNPSMIYVARTTAGVIAIDLGFVGSGRPFARALADLGATPEDVKTVFLTHSHRDHIALWPEVRKAQFHLAAAEVPRLLGQSPHEGWIASTADKLNDPELPKPDELTIRAFAADTTFVVGADTLRAYLVPGHTPGAAVYLFRGVLFLGDAVTWTPWRGFGPAKAGYSDDTKVARENLARLWQRLPTGAVKHACTAHARCGEFTAVLADLR